MIIQDIGWAYLRLFLYFPKYVSVEHTIPSIGVIGEQCVVIEVPVFALADEISQ